MKPQQIRDELQALLSGRGFDLHSFAAPDSAAMGAWFVDFRSSSLTVVAGQDRTGDVTHVCVGKLVDPTQRKGRIGRQPLCRVRGFFNGDESNALFDDEASQIYWLKQNLGRVLEHVDLNLPEFQKWIVADSRRMFRQDSNNDG